MGWWQITENLHNGDTPADIMGTAVEDISRAYSEEFGRPPYLEELAATLLFVTQGSYEAAGEPVVHGPGLGYALVERRDEHGPATKNRESSVSGRS
jgi:hypothetical protein